MNNRVSRVAAAACIAMTVSGCGTLRGASQALSAEPRQPRPGPNIAIAEAGADRVEMFGYAIFHNGLPTCTNLRSIEGGLADNPSEAITCSNISVRGLGGNALETYLDRRIFIIDAYCDAYLDSLASLGDSSRWTRSQFNTVSNYLSVLMALAGSPTADLGYLNAATAFFNSSSDNLETLVLISAAPGSLTPLVDAAQTSMRADLAGIRQGDASLRWSGYSRWLQAYAAQCTPRGIRLLIDEAIDASAAADNPLQIATSASQLSAVLEQPLQQMAANDGLRSNWPDLGKPETLGALVWFIRSNDTLTTEQRRYIATLLQPNLTGTVTAALANDVHRPSLQQLLVGPNQAQFDELARYAQNRFASVSEAETARRNATAATAAAAAAVDTAATRVQEARTEAAQEKERADRLQRELDALRASMSP